MSPAEKHAANQGRTEALPEALRAGLAADGGATSPPAYKDHRTGRKVPQVSRGALTARQKSVLGILARDAHAFQSRLGLVDPGLTIDEWRHAESIAVVGCRISQAKQAHYLPLKGHFESLAGSTTLATFRASTAPFDDPDRKTVAQALRRELAAFAQIPDDRGKPTGSHRAEDYLLAIARSRAVGPVTTTVADLIAVWPIRKLWTLVYTLRNRIAAKTGRGHPSDRNKSQRSR